MTTPLTLVVLAAGIGSRYGGLKQMEALGPSGEFLIDYSVFDAVRAGFGRIVFVIRRDFEDAFRASIGRRAEQRVAVDYAFQELDALPDGFRLPHGRKKPWGTGHAVLVCRDVLGGPFGVINADDFYGRESYAELAGFLRSTAEDTALHGTVLFALENTLSGHGSVARGVCRTDGAGFLESIEEITDIRRDGETVRSPGRAFSGQEPVSMNMWGFKPGFVDALDAGFADFLARAGSDMGAEFYLPSAVHQLMAAGRARVKVLRSSAQWIGVTNPEDRQDAVGTLAELVHEGVYSSPLPPGQGADPE